MSDTNNNGGNGNAASTANAAGTAVGRETRSNHAPATSHPITDAASAQAFCDAAIQATRGDKQAAMFNGSGFVTPEILDRQDVDNRTRMGASIINSLAASVEQDGEVGTAAAAALQILASYATTAGTARENAKNDSIRRQYEALLASGKVEARR